MSMPGVVGHAVARACSLRFLSHPSTPTDAVMRQRNGGDATRRRRVPTPAVYDAAAAAAAAWERAHRQPSGHDGN